VVFSSFLLPLRFIRQSQHDLGIHRIILWNEQIFSSLLTRLEQKLPEQPVQLEGRAVAAV
jgi:hypothetical protein